MKGYIFDYGGTLDTGGCHWGKMIWHAYRQNGIPVTWQQFRDAYVHGERTLGTVPIVRKDFTFRQTLEAKVRLQLEYLSLPLSFLPSLISCLYSDVLCHTAHSREVLGRLPEPKVLVSNFYGNMTVVLREFGLDGLFCHVVESAEVGVRKPDPRIFTLGIGALGLRPQEVTVVGDSVSKDIIPARQAGCRTVWLRGEQWTDESVDECAADRIITDLSELLTT